MLSLSFGWWHWNWVTFFWFCTKIRKHSVGIYYSQRMVKTLFFSFISGIECAICLFYFYFFSYFFFRSVCRLWAVSDRWPFVFFFFCSSFVSIVFVHFRFMYRSYSSILSFDVCLRKWQVDRPGEFFPIVLIYNYLWFRNFVCEWNIFDSSLFERNAWMLEGWRQTLSFDFRS